VGLTIEAKGIALFRKKFYWMGLVAGVALAGHANAQFDPSANVIIHHDFDGDVVNKATGPSSVFALGDGWRATITGYDWMYKKSRHASGGALSMLWHQDVGLILSASLTEYVMTEPHNMQENNDPLTMALTPRVELIADEKRHTNIDDVTAGIEYQEKEQDIVFSVSAKLVDQDQMPPLAAAYPAR
jgi:hypothetical protein